MALSQREKVMVSVGGVCVVIFIFLYFIFLPLVDNRARLDRKVKKQAQQLVEMGEMHKQYRAFNTQNLSMQSVLEARSPEFSLFSFLEMNAAGSQVKDLIVYMKPSTVRENDSFAQSQVEMKLQAIDLKRLVDFLEHVESPENLVGIKRVSIQRNNKETGTLDVVLQIVSVDDIFSTSP